MTVLLEKDIREQLKNDAVKEIHILRTESRHYEVYFLLTWAKAPAPFYTQRNTLRTWASLDRLISHIETLHTHIPAIRLFINKGSDINAIHPPSPPQEPG